MYLGLINTISIITNKFSNTKSIISFIVIPVFIRFQNCVIIAFCSYIQYTCLISFTENNKILMNCFYMNNYIFRKLQLTYEKMIHKQNHLLVYNGSHKCEQ